MALVTALTALTALGLSRVALQQQRHQETQHEATRLLVLRLPQAI
jgi:hypothetical protein